MVVIDTEGTIKYTSQVSQGVVDVPQQELQDSRQHAEARYVWFGRLGRPSADRHWVRLSQASLS